ncbi:MAG: hypothetical protein M3Z64_05085 [Verrucomicrobiota bacterium]|nr:hypothetical protein [Verrucomicrobiota bacterium]
MNSSLKWRLAAGVLIVFLAGLATGVFATAWHIQHHVAGARADVIAQRMRRHLTNRLGLTTDQLAKISPVIDQTAHRLDEIRAESGRRVAETMEQSRRDMAPNLTPEQLASFDQMRERRRHGMRRGRAFSPAPADRP